MAKVLKKIGLLHHLGGGNLGDDASLDAVIGNIKSRWPNAMLCAFTMNPGDTQARHGIPAYQIRREIWPSLPQTAERGGSFFSRAKRAVKKYPLISRPLEAINKVAIRMPRAVAQELMFLANSFRALRSTDLLIFTGGGQLLDAWGGPWKFPYTNFKWTLLAKVSRAKCYFINVGAGPLSHRLGRWFVKRTLALADYASFRDEESRALVRQIGYRAESQVHADNVYSLEIPSVFTNGNGRRGESVVGISPMPYCDPRAYWQRNQNIYDNFIHTVALFGSWIVEHEHRLTIFTTDIWFDEGAIRDFKVALERDFGLANSPRIRHEPVTGIEELLSVMASMDYIVTCRFHGVVFAHLLNKPVLAISHHPKVSKLMSDLGLSRYCVDILKCDLNVLSEAFTSLVKNSEEVKNRMAEKATSYRKDLSIQFDQLFPQQTGNGLVRRRASGRS